MPVKTQSAVTTNTHLEVTFGGNDGMGDFETYMPTVFAEMRQHHLKRALLDFSHVAYQDGTLVEHRFGEFVASKPFPGSRFAVIASAGCIEGCRHLENVARNRGCNLRVFEDRQQAVEWLVSPKS